MRPALGAAVFDVTVNVASVPSVTGDVPAVIVTVGNVLLVTACSLKLSVSRPPESSILLLLSVVGLV